MKKQLKFIELKSGYANEDGPAWIGYVEFSKSGRTMYFDGKALKGNGHGACVDIETGEKYWASGIKKYGSNRHVFGTGVVFIEEAAVEEFLNVTGRTSLNPQRYTVVNLTQTDKLKFMEIENSKLYDLNESIPENSL